MRIAVWYFVVVRQAPGFGKGAHYVHSGPWRRGEARSKVAGLNLTFRNSHHQAYMTRNVPQLGCFHSVSNRPEDGRGHHPAVLHQETNAPPDDLGDLGL